MLKLRPHGRPITERGTIPQNKAEVHSLTIANLHPMRNKNELRIAQVLNVQVNRRNLNWQYVVKSRQATKLGGTVHSNGLADPPAASFPISTCTVSAPALRDIYMKITDQDPTKIPEHSIVCTSTTSASFSTNSGRPPIKSAGDRPSQHPSA